MKVRSLFLATAALAAVGLAPSKASAQSPCTVGVTYAASLGLGGTLTGCFGATLQELGENAGAVSRQFYWNGTFAGNTNAAPSNAPVLAGTEFFNDDCGSQGSFSFTTFAWCSGGTWAPAVTATGATLPTIGAATGQINNLTGEFVLGLFTPDLSNPQSNGGVNYWMYSGAFGRNAYPAPAGYQQVLFQLANNGVPIDGEFLFAWEDINSGCLSVAGSALHPSLTLYNVQDLNSQQKMDDPNNCNSFNGGVTGASDSDFNDSYIVLNIAGQRLDTVTPEPMTMTLMATGLVGLAGAQIRRRKKNQG